MYASIPADMIFFYEDTKGPDPSIFTIKSSGGMKMDRVFWIMIGVLALWILLRLRYSLRKSRKNLNKGEEIQRKLQLLRKKRDEE
jgi:hypothetical protein